jgi:hypothetical protein
VAGGRVSRRRFLQFLGVFPLWELRGNVRADNEFEPRVGVQAFQFADGVDGVTRSPSFAFDVQHLDGIAQFLECQTAHRDPMLEGGLFLPEGVLGAGNDEDALDA